MSSEVLSPRLFVQRSARGEEGKLLLSSEYNVAARQENAGTPHLAKLMGLQVFIGEHTSTTPSQYRTHLTLDDELARAKGMFVAMLACNPWAKNTGISVQIL